MSYSGESMVDENESISARAGQPHVSTDDLVCPSINDEGVTVTV